MFIPERNAMRTWHFLAYAHPETNRNSRNAKLLLGFSLVAVALGGIGLIVFSMSDFGVSDGGPGSGMQIASAKSDMTSYQTMLDAFQIDNGRYPTASEGLDALVNPPTDVTNWKGPYIKRLRNDPWGHPFRYVPPTKTKPNSYQLTSAGPDGKFGTPDDISPPL